MNHLFALLPGISAALSIGLGLFVYSKNRTHPSNIGFALGMLSLSIIQTGNTLSLLSETDFWILFWKRFSLLGRILLVPTWLLFSLTFARTAYQEVLVRWKPIFIGTSFIALFFIPWLGSPYMISLPENAVQDTHFILGPLGRSFYIFFLLGIVLNLVHLENTLRSSSGSDRWQIKYIVLGVGSILAFQIYLASQYLLFSQLDTRFIPATSIVILIAEGLMLFFIVRHRLLGVDIFISRYVIYNSLTVLFVGGYLLAVGIGAQIIQWLGGPFDILWSTVFSFLAILVMLILFLSTGVRRKAQLFINRHFYKHKYEFRDKWMETTEQIEAGSSLEELQKTIVSMIQETLGARQIAFYLYDPDHREYYLAETSFPKAVSRVMEDHSLVRHMKETRVPFFLDKNMEEDEGGRNNEFIIPGAILCTPFVAGQEIVGFLCQGEDLTGIPYGTDDFEILKAISTQAAGRIKNIRLSRELLAAKEAEALHQVSGFFIHDMKNFVSTLSLLVQNAEEHLSRPDFQRDALRTLKTTVSKMNDLIAKLTALSKKANLHLHPVHVNELLDQTLSTLNGQISSRLSVTKETFPPIIADGEQLQKVILNLLLNALEASQADGKIQVRTVQKNNEVVLTVSDEGCGMSRDFIQSSLFKPFQSTKPQGLGIGLFQCKKIVESHGGKIEVSSEVGKGSEFRVILPSSRSGSPIDK